MKKTPISPPNLSPFFERELKEVKAWLRISGYADTSIEGCSWTLRRLFIWMQQQEYTKLNKAILSAYLLFLDHKAWSANTYRITFYGLKKYLQFLFTFRQLNIDIKLPDYKGTPPRPVYLSLLQIQQLYTYIDKQEKDEWKRSCYRMILAVFYAAGLRLSEGLALKISDVDFQRKGLLVGKGKGGKSRFVPMIGPSMQDIKTYILQTRPIPKTESAAYLIISNEGNAHSRGAIYYRLKKLALANNIPPFGPHVLRHSIATHLLQGGMNIYQIQGFLGHKTLASTQIYTHYEPS